MHKPELKALLLMKQKGTVIQLQIILEKVIEALMIQEITLIKKKGLKTILTWIN